MTPLSAAWREAKDKHIENCLTRKAKGEYNGSGAMNARTDLLRLLTFIEEERKAAK